MSYFTNTCDSTYGHDYEWDEYDVCACIDDVLDEVSDNGDVLRQILSVLIDIRESLNK